MENNMQDAKIYDLFQGILKSNEIRLLLKKGSRIKLKKGAYFSFEDTYCNKIGILLKGMLYSFNFDENGNKQIFQFYFIPNNYIVIDYKSYTTNQKADASIAVIEDCELLIFDTDYIQKLENRNLDFVKVQLEIAKQKYLFSQEIISVLQTKNLIDKIKVIKEKSPELLCKVPYSYLASYLGVHRNTLNLALNKM